jgi:hypothetical protein
MILYKYYGYKSGIEALKSSQLGFTRPNFFNDPFELTSISNLNGDGPSAGIIKHTITEIKNNVAILSLTKEPLNKLMWSHYADGYQGFAIGYKVDNNFLNDEKLNFITVDSGDVFYTNKKFEINSGFKTVASIAIGQKLLEGKNENLNNIFERKSKKDIKKMLLTKHSSWHYEDEVRVVKYISTDPDLQTRYQSDDNTKHLLINNNKTLLFNYNAEIKEVYLGLNNPLFGNIKPSENKILFDKAKAGNWSVYVAQMAKESWDLTRHELGQSTLLLPN